MPRTRRPSVQTVAVLRALAQQPREWRHGYNLCQELGLKAGSMYPILMRLADRGLLTTSWEIGAEAGGPRRHVYQLTRSGLDLVSELKTESARGRRLRLDLRGEGA